MSPQFKSLLTRTISGAVFVALVVGSFFVPSYFQFALFVFFAAVATYEYLHIVETDGIRSHKVLGVLMTVLMVEGGYIRQSMSFGWLLVVLLMLSIPVIELFRKGEKPFNNIAHNFLPVLWIGVPFTLAGVTNVMLFQEEALLALFILLWTSDTFAYCGGSLFGKHKMFERISPKKTWEGFAIGGLFACGVAVGLSFVPYFHNALLYEASTTFNVLAWLGFGLVVFVTGTLGDLIESMFKRSYGVKDSGNIMPGHGGMLDRFDSFLFAMPFCMIYWVLITFIY